MWVHPTVDAGDRPRTHCAGEKVLIYTHYVDGIDKELRDGIEAAGYNAGLLTVLIASSCIGTGVNGLQYVCRKLIINSLPWTNTEYEQLVGGGADTREPVVEHPRPVRVGHAGKHVAAQLPVLRDRTRDDRPALRSRR